MNRSTTQPVLDPAQRRAALIAGFMYLFVIVGSILFVQFVRPQLIVPGDAAATASRVAAGGLLFRGGTVYELLTAVGVIVLAWALYVLLRPIDKDLALLGLCGRMVEAIVWMGAVLVSHVVLLVVSEEAAGAFAAGQRHALIGMLIRLYTTAMDVVILFTGLGTTVFCYLLYRARYLPRALAAWGILTYLSMIVFSTAKLLFPSLASWDVIVYSPGGVFEVVVGVWLVVRGVKAPAAADTVGTPLAAS
jgi:hypothetical protein